MSVVTGPHEHAPPCVLSRGFSICFENTEFHFPRGLTPHLSWHVSSYHKLRMLSFRLTLSPLCHSPPGCNWAHFLLSVKRALEMLAISRNYYQVAWESKEKPLGLSFNDKATKVTCHLHHPLQVTQSALVQWGRRFHRVWILGSEDCWGLWEAAYYT